MFVVKRNLKKAVVAFDKITLRMKGVCTGLNKTFVDPVLLTQKVIPRLRNGMTTSELDEEAGAIAANLIPVHPDYGVAALRIEMSNLHKNTMVLDQSGPKPVLRARTFAETIKMLYQNEETRYCLVTNKLKKFINPLIADKMYTAIQLFAETLEDQIDYTQDYNNHYFGLKTLQLSYLMKINEHIVERPQHMLMRVACQRFLLDDDVDKVLASYQEMNTKIQQEAANVAQVIKDYKQMTNKLYTPATPTLYHAGSPHPQLSSCFLIRMFDDSIKGIYKTIGDIAEISKWAGGICVDVTDIRATDSKIYGTNGRSGGLLPLLKVLNEVAKHVNQGGGKRKGSFAINIEPWHRDIREVISAKLKTGNHEFRANDLFYSIWMNDLFMLRVKENAMWSLFCPNEAKGLHDVYGEEFRQKYEEYEAVPGLAREQIPARELWEQMLTIQQEAGGLYMMAKDSINFMSNHKNVGPIFSSNLCCEIVLHTSKLEIAVCNLTSMALPNFAYANDLVSSSSREFSLSKTDKLADVTYDELSQEDKGCLLDPSKFLDDKVFNHEKFFNSVTMAALGLNKTINKTFNPTVECDTSNKRHRPIGIGSQGLQDLYFKLNYAFESPEAEKLDKEIFETMYYAALSASHGLAVKYGPYSTFKGSPLSQGLFHFDLWKQNYDRLTKSANLKVNAQVLNEKTGKMENQMAFDEKTGQMEPVMIPRPPFEVKHSGRWDWEGLRKKIVRDGVYNSHVLAMMPTASTSQILGFNETNDPQTSNILVRRTLAGDFVVTNEYLFLKLEERGLLTPDFKSELIRNNGSIQHIKWIPDDIKKVFKTIWEIPLLCQAKRALARAMYIDQTQSLSLHLQRASFEGLTTIMFYIWEGGGKTIVYYVRTKPSVEALKFTEDPLLIKKEQEERDLIENLKSRKIYLEPLPLADILERSFSSTSPTTPAFTNKKRKRNDSDADSSSIEDGPPSSKSTKFLIEGEEEGWDAENMITSGGESLEAWRARRVKEKEALKHNPEMEAKGCAGGFCSA